jgi:hypothetical protein
MLKNIVYSPRFSRRPYRLVDLSSGGVLRPERALDPGSGRGQDLLRMCLSLARNQFSRDDALRFLSAYQSAFHGNRDEDCYGAEKLMEVCLAADDHRASEAADLFGCREEARHDDRPTRGGDGREDE